jgi:capsid portal protein
MRDTWLNSGKRDRSRIEKAAAAASGQLHPTSEHAYRMLVTAPGIAKITHWGGETDPTGRVTVIKRGLQDAPPESRQLKDPFTTFYVQGVALEPPLPLDRMLNLTEENTLHSACLMAKATDACGRGWDFSPKDGQESDEDLISSDVPAKLREHMEDLTPDLTFSEMLYQAAWEMGSLGQGIWEILREDTKQPNVYGQVAAIYPIPAQMVRATLDPRKWVQIRAGRIRYFKKFGARCTIDNESGTVYEWDDKRQLRDASALSPNRVASELIVFKEYTPRSLWYGVPKWVSAIPTIAEMTAIREFNVSWFASGGQTDFHIHVKANDMEVAREMKQQIKTQIEDNRGRGHTLLVTAGTVDTEVKVEKLGELLREGHFRFRRGDLAKEVLIAHCVPPYRIGWAETGSLGGNAAPEMLSAYKFGGIEPIQTVMQDRLRMTLFNKDLGGIDTGAFRLKLKGLDYDVDESGKTIDKVKSAILTPNQGREEMGYDVDDERPEMDEYYWNGQPLGAAPSEPGGGSPFGPDGQPLPGQGEPAPGDEPPVPGDEPPVPGDQGQQPLSPPQVPPQQAFRRSVQRRAVQRRAPRKSARSVIERFEKALRDSLVAEASG